MSIPDQDKSRIPEQGILTRTFTLKINAAVVMLLAILWSYGVRHSAQPIAMPSLLEGCLLAGVGIGLLKYYGKYTFPISLSKLDLAALGCFALVLGVVHSKMLVEPINGDELLHAKDSMLFLALSKTMYSAGIATNYFDTVPLNDISYHFTALALLIFIAVVIGWRKLSAMTIRWPLYTLVFLISVLTCILFAQLPQELSRHPPMRLLPLFLGHFMLGPQNIAFRLPGVICSIMISFAAYRLVRLRHKKLIVLPFICGLIVSMIPTVLHAASAVESSIWGYGIGLISFILIIRAYESDEFHYVVLAGALIGAGTLARQNAIIFWPAVILATVLHTKFRKKLIKNMFTACLPGLLALPYFLTAKKVGLDAQFGGGAINNIIQSLTSGTGPRAILVSTSAIWLVAATVGVIITIAKGRTGPKWLYALVIPGYALFYSIQQWLWGVGRYQAEYIAPFIALAALLISLDLRKSLRSVLVAIMVFLCLHGIHTNRAMHQDIYYQNWPRGRITTSKYFPFDEALGFLQRQESGGNFMVLGGIGMRGEPNMAMYGFTLRDTIRFEELSGKLRKFQQSPDSGDLNKLFELMRTNKVRYLLVQYGEKIELHHRHMNYGPRMHTLYAQLGRYYRDHKGKQYDYIHLHTFYGKHSGVLDLYGLANLRYGPYGVELDTPLRKQ